MGFFDSFKKALSGFTKKDLMEAAVFGCFFVASADGDISEQEKDKVERLLRNNESLRKFGSDLDTCVAAAKKDFEQGGARIIKHNALGKLRAISSRPEEAEMVLIMMITIAETDGDIAESEKKALQEAASALNADLNKHL